MPRQKKAEAIEISEANITSFADLLASKLGKDKVSIMSGDFASHVTDYISTQCPALDQALGHPGIPVGRVTTFVGDTSTGKTTLMYHLLGETQRRGGVAIYIDAESAALDPDRAREMGVDPDNLIIVVPESAENACATVEEIIENSEKLWPGRLVLIVLDSVAGLAAEAELNGEIGDRVIAPLARVFNPVMRRLPSKIARTNTALVLVNQYRTNIGGGPFGPSRVMPAESPVEYASSVIVEISRTGKLVEGDGDNKEAIGIQCKAYIKKNKVAKPFKTCQFKIMFEPNGEIPAGLNVEDSLFIIGRRMGIIEAPSVGWYAYGERRFREKEFPKILMDNPNLTAEIVSAMALPEPYASDGKIGTYLNEVGA